MSKLGIFDIVALAKAGFKASDIKEFTSIDIPDDVKEDKEDEENKNPDVSGQPPAENSEKGTEKDKAGSETSDDDIDYKKLYEEKCAELEKAQKENTLKTIPKETEDKRKSIDDIVRSFM